METTLKQKIGMILSLSGGVLILGFNWVGGITIVIGFVLVIVGLILALRKESQSKESNWIHNNTPDDD